jgi:hypothetical protein
MVPMGPLLMGQLLFLEAEGQLLGALHTAALNL